MRATTILGLFFVAMLPAGAGEDLVPADFTGGIRRYMDLRKQAVKGLPTLPAKAEPEQLARHKQTEAEAIRGARANARQGDVLSPSAQTFLKEIVRSEMKGQKGQPARKAAQQGNPANGEEGAPVRVAVNGTYPDNAAASTVPPTLLLRLPKLPKELDFRFVGPHLILRDVNAGLIVDFVPNAMP